MQVPFRDTPLQGRTVLGQRLICWLFAHFACSRCQAPGYSGNNAETRKAEAGDGSGTLKPESTSIPNKKLFVELKTSHRWGVPTCATYAFTARGIRPVGLSGSQVGRVQGRTRQVGMMASSNRDI